MNPDEASPSNLSQEPGAFCARLLQDLGEPVCAFDLEDRLVFINQAAADLLGRGINELMGLRECEVFGEEICEQLRRENEARSRGISTTYEVVGHDPAGRERTLLITGSPLRGPDGTIIGSCGALRDITARKHREKETELRMRLTLGIAESMRVLLTSADFNQALRDSLSKIGQILGARSGTLFQLENGGIHQPKHEWRDEQSLLESSVVRHDGIEEQRFGWWMSQLAGRRVLSVASPDELPAEAVEEKRVMQRLGITSLLAVSIDYRGKRQGLVLFENPCHLPQFSAENLSLIVMLADVFASALDRRKSESERGLLITAVEQADASIVITDAKGIILYVNPAFERVSGYTRREVLGQNPRVLKSGRQSASFYQEMWETLNCGMVWTGELINRHKNGSLFHESCSISPIMDAAGTVSRFVAVKRDLTRERNLETKLRQSQTLEAVGRLAAGVAHELNTPSQYIGDNLGFFQEAMDNLLPYLKRAMDCLEVVSQGQEATEQAGDLLAQATELDLDFLLEDIPRALAQSREGVERVTNIVLAMKEFSHPGSQSKKASDLNRMVRSTVTVARAEWKYIAQVELDLDEGLPQLVCHTAEVNQAILNLLVNAAHAIAATGAGQDEQPMGLIRIRTRRGDNAALLEIEDSGGGIPPDVLPHIFAPFFTTKDVGKGTGQGLAVVRNVVVDKHGGSIDVETQEGEGSIFRIRLPFGESPDFPQEAKETGRS